MVDVTVEDLAAVGLVRDQPGYKLHPSAWTYAENIRFNDKRAKALSGTSSAYGALLGKPYFLMPAIGSGGTKFTIYSDLVKVYATDGTAHAEITGATTPAATAAKNWSGCTLGGIPIISDGATAPQTWVPNLANDLANLTNWPVNSFARVIRAFGPNLVALGPKFGGVQYPHGILWSHPADPGAYPSSWDITDPTKDAGLTELSDAWAGTVQDGVMLGGQMFIYKERATWAMRRVGGQKIFDFLPYMETSGILGPRCAALTGDGKWHFVASGDNVLVHNGSNTIIPLLDDRMRKTVFNAIDSANFANSFVFAHPTQNEMWFCYPENGATAPTRALIWNYKQGGIQEGELGTLAEATVHFQCAVSGDVSASGLGIWSALTDTWDALTPSWSSTARQQLLIGNTVGSLIEIMDTSASRSGTAYKTTLQRLGIGLIGMRAANSQNAKGVLVTDFTKSKFVSRIWIDAEGQSFNVRLGQQANVDGPVTWTDPSLFTPGTDKFLDFEVTGMALAVEFSHPTRSGWEILSYKFEMFVNGRFA